MSVLWWILFAVIWIAIAFWPARVAGRKGHSFIGYFIFSLFFFPAAIIVAYLVPTAPISRAGLRPLSASAECWASGPLSASPWTARESRTNPGRSETNDS